ncbi:MgtC/SapB family protein [Jeotgalibaca caeni]|uniref:MgtC/SapB family protein n=1 Tax=Jeotgalibaca caeni TaxID=3028623 RepID=UPI00237DE2C2|nr:MgtC/SapB family protein [Jeotgalibaca caeni]MDE1549013.1 MgtC/SapB family protein [Jeotgalibaca caeni]
MYDLDILEITLRLLIAVGIGATIGFERESTHQSAGLRTNIIVCVASCVLTIIQIEVSYAVIRMGLSNPDLQSMLSTDFARITAQIVSGIGFLGAGAILTTKMDTVSGLTTAATIWGVAGLGIAVGMGYYYLSIISCLIILIVLFVMKRLIRTGEIFLLEIKLTDRDAIAKFNDLFKLHKMKTTDEDFRMERTADGVIFHIMYTVYVPKTLNHNDLIDEFLAITDSISEISFRD